MEINLTNFWDLYRLLNYSLMPIFFFIMIILSLIIGYLDDLGNNS